MPVIVIVEPSAVKLSKAIFPTLVIFLSLKDIAPVPLVATVMSPSTPSAMVIEPLLVPAFVLRMRSPVPHVVIVALAS